MCHNVNGADFEHIVSLNDKQNTTQHMKKKQNKQKSRINFVVSCTMKVQHN